MTIFPWSISVTIAMVKGKLIPGFSNKVIGLINQLEEFGEVAYGDKIAV